MIIQYASTKGGVSKTTCAVQSSILYDNVALVDLDPNKTATTWASERIETYPEKKKIVPYTISGIATDSRIEELSNIYENLIIDSAGSHDVVNNEMIAGMVLADVVIFPLKPDHFDIWQVNRLEKIFLTCKKLNPKLKGFFLVTQAHTNYKIDSASEFADAVEGCESIGLLKTVIHNRRSYSKANGMYLSCLEVDDRSFQKSKDEILSLYKEINKEALT